jgi:hypothetical protein
MTHDDIKIKRNKKSDKERRNQEIYGKFSSKHVRQMESLQEKRELKNFVVKSQSGGSGTANPTQGR